MAELQEGQDYFISKFKKITGLPYGDAILASLSVKNLKDEWEDVDTFLPKRYTTIISATDIDAYNASPNLHLIYKGRTVTGKYITSFKEKDKP